MNILKSRGGGEISALFPIADPIYRILIYIFFSLHNNEPYFEIIWRFFFSKYIPVNLVHLENLDIRVKFSNNKYSFEYFLFSIFLCLSKASPKQSQFLWLNMGPSFFLQLKFKFILGWNGRLDEISTFYREIGLWPRVNPILIPHLPTNNF